MLFFLLFAHLGMVHSSSQPHETVMAEATRNVLGCFNITTRPTRASSRPTSTVQATPPTRASSAACGSCCPPKAAVSTLALRSGDDDLDQLRASVKPKHLRLPGEAACALQNACEPDGATGWGPVVNKCMPTSGPRAVGAVGAHILPFHACMLAAWGPKYCMYGGGKFWFYQWYGWYVQPFCSWAGDSAAKLYASRDFKKAAKDMARDEQAGMSQAALDNKYFEYNGLVYTEPIGTDGTNDPFTTGKLPKSTVHFSGVHGKNQRVEHPKAREVRLANHAHEHKPHHLRNEGKHCYAGAVEMGRSARAPFVSLGSCVTYPLVASARTLAYYLPHSLTEFTMGPTEGLRHRAQMKQHERLAILGQGATTTEQRAREHTKVLSPELQQRLKAAIADFKCCDQKDCFALEKLQADVGLVFPTIAGKGEGLTKREMLERAIFEQIIADPNLTDTLMTHRPHAANLHNFLCGDNVYIQGEYGVIRSMTNVLGKDGRNMLEITLATDRSTGRDIARYLDQFESLQCVRNQTAGANANERKFFVDPFDLDTGKADISCSLFQFHNAHANKFWQHKSDALHQVIREVKAVLNALDEGCSAEAVQAVLDAGCSAADVQTVLADLDAGCSGPYAAQAVLDAPVSGEPGDGDSTQFSNDPANWVQ